MEEMGEICKCAIDCPNLPKKYGQVAQLAKCRIVQEVESKKSRKKSSAKSATAMYYSGAAAEKAAASHRIAQSVNQYRNCNKKGRPFFMFSCREHDEPLAFPVTD